MKRYLHLIFLLFFFDTQGQTPDEGCKSGPDISKMESIYHGRRATLLPRSAASTNFDVHHYGCNWDMNPASRYIKGSVTIDFTLTSTASSITLDLRNELTVDSVTQKGSKLVFLHSNHELKINFAAPINQGAKDSVTVYYKGAPAITGFGAFVQSTHAGVPVIWTLSEPYGSMDWWPCKNGLDDKADSIDIFITHSPAYKAAANGMLQSETLLTGGTKMLTHWKHRYPIATYLLGFAVTNYAMFDSHVQLGSHNLLVQTHCYPEHLATFQANTPKVLEAMVLLNNNFGDYPFMKEKYGHVQFHWGGGMEHQTASFITSSDESLMAHELGHQWFGDKITCATWVDLWLNEGFATHMASMHMESKYPANTIATRKSEINNITSVPTGSVKIADTTNLNLLFNHRITYLKASHLLYMLRWKLGDATFFKAARSYMADPALKYGFAKTEDLKRNLEQVSGQDLTEFFNDWYSGQGYPSYNVQWSQFGPGSVKIIMNQTSAHPSVSFFEMPVALKFKNATQEKTVVVDHLRNGQEFYRSIGFIPDTVLVDPDYWLISRNNKTEKIAATSPITPIIRIYPNPSRGDLSVLLSGLPSSPVRLDLFNALGQLVHRRNIELLNGSEYLELGALRLASGAYWLKLSDGKSFNYSKKILRL